MLSKHNPLLPRRWNSGLLRLLMECPQKLLLGGIQGWRTREESAHLDFGSMLQECQDTFLRSRLAGAGKEGATLEAVKRALQISGYWVEDINFQSDCRAYATYHWHPWGGRYETLWRCTGTKPYRNEKGNKAKCPHSHKGVWTPFSEQMQEIYELLNTPDDTLLCRDCGSELEVADHYIPQHPTKNRVTLLRAVVALCDSQAEEGGIQPVRLPNEEIPCPDCDNIGYCMLCEGAGILGHKPGKDAVELEVVVPLGRKTPKVWRCVNDGCPENLDVEWTELPQDDCGLAIESWGLCPACTQPTEEAGDEDYELVCHFDEMVTYRGRTYVLDNKSTDKSIDDKTKAGRAWWQQWAPNLQIDLYDLVGSLAFPDLDVAGCAVRGVQVTREQANVGVKLITKTEGQREEFLADIHHYLDRAEEYARTGYFPMNRAACKGCQFAPVCDMDPAFREATLRADYVQQPDERLFLPQED